MVGLFCIQLAVGILNIPDSGTGASMGTPLGVASAWNDAPLAYILAKFISAPRTLRTG